jgi:hypothetical protein
MPLLGWRVKRNSRPGICQNIRLDTNMRAQLSPLSSRLVPTEELEVAIKPILSSFGIRFRPRSTPSLVMLIFQSPLGLPQGGVSLEASVSRTWEGSGWWKYQYRVTQSIMAIWRVGLAAGLNSLLEGLAIDEMKSLSLSKVGVV